MTTSCRVVFVCNVHFIPIDTGPSLLPVIRTNEGHVIFHDLPHAAPTFRAGSMAATTGSSAFDIRCRPAMILAGPYQQRIPTYSCLLKRSKGQIPRNGSQQMGKLGVKKWQFGNGSRQSVMRTGHAHDFIDNSEFEKFGIRPTVRPPRHGTHSIPTGAKRAPDPSTRRRRGDVASSALQGPRAHESRGSHTTAIMGTHTQPYGYVAVDVPHGSASDTRDSAYDLSTILTQSCSSQKEAGKDEPGCVPQRSVARLVGRRDGRPAAATTTVDVRRSGQRCTKARICCASVGERT